MSDLVRGRWLLVFAVCTVPALFPNRAAGECNPAWEEYYRKGNSVSDKYTAEKDAVCSGTCLDEKLYFYRRAVELCPESDRSHVNLADTLEQLGQYPAAEEHYRQAIRINPKRAEAYFGLGDLAFDAGQFATAAADYKRGLDIQPDDAQARERRANALRLQGQSIVDSASIEQVLGGAPLTTMGPGGLKEDRRLPLRIEFDTDKDGIRPEAQRQLKEMGEALKHIIAAHPDAAFVIEGHTDVRGSDAHNDDLSQRRAKRVVQELVGQFKIPLDHLGSKGYGKRRLRKPGESDADHQINRRVEVVRYEVAELATLAREAMVAPVSETASAASRDATLEAAVFYEDQESRPLKLQANATLHSGDGYRVYFRPKKKQYLYVVQQDATKKLFPIFPNPAFGYTANQVEAGKEYWVPEGKWLALDHTPGPEVIYFIASSQPRTDIEDLLRRAAEAPKPGAPADTDSTYEILSMGEIHTMGVDPSPHEGRKVAVAAPSGKPVEVSVDELVGRGVDLVHKLSFRHE